MTNVIHALLSYLFITIPEDAFMIIITLRLMGRKDMLDIYNLKENLITIFKIVIPSATLINIFEYIIKTPSSINKPLAFIILYLTLVYILKTNSFLEDDPKSYIKSFGFFILSILVAIAIEMISFPIIFKLINKTFQEIKMDFYIALICSFSSRIIDILILAWIFTNKNRKFQIQLGQYVFKNKFFMRSILSIFLGLIVFEGYTVKLILQNNFLNIVNTVYEQLFIVIGSTFLIPAILISLIYSYIDYCILVQNSEKQTIRND